MWLATWAVGVSRCRPIQHVSMHVHVTVRVLVAVADSRFEHMQLVCSAQAERALLLLLLLHQPAAAIAPCCCAALPLTCCCQLLIPLLADKMLVLNSWPR